MKAVILSAGYGSRLLPLTLEMPKCLVEVQGRAILLHQLTALARAGIDEAVVVVGYRHEQVDRFLDRDLPLAVSTRFNPFWSIGNSIGSVWAVRDLLGERFCLLNGDTVFDPAVLARTIGHTAPGVGLLVEPIAAAVEDDMRVAVSAGRVQAVAKTLADARTTHRSLGVVVNGAGDAQYRDALDRVIARDGGHAAYHHAIVDELAQAGLVAAIERPPGHWQEIDRPEDIAAWRRAHDA